MRRWFPLLALLGLTACAEGGPPTVTLAASVVIVNESQYTLEELRVHRTPDYRSADNVLTSGLGIDEDILFYGDGEWYLTVLRERYHLGPILAFTTAQPIDLERERGYRLTVFDESFRLEDDTWLDPGAPGRLYYGDPYPDGRPIADAGAPD